MNKLMISLTLTRFYIFLSKSWHEHRNARGHNLMLPVQLLPANSLSDLEPKLSLLIAKGVHARSNTHKLVFLLSISATHKHTHNTVLSACYTWPLISPWCPISLDLWWPSFRSSNIKALKCPVSQPHTRARTHTDSYSTHAITLFLFYTACWGSHTRFHLST